MAKMRGRIRQLKSILVSALLVASIRRFLCYYGADATT